jgi:hypothetical protein
MTTTTKTLPPARGLWLPRVRFKAPMMSFVPVLADFYSPYLAFPTPGDTSGRRGLNRACRESAVLEVALVGACRILLHVVATDVNAISLNCAAALHLSKRLSQWMHLNREDESQRPCPIPISLSPHCSSPCPCSSRGAAAPALALPGHQRSR